VQGRTNRRTRGARCLAALRARPLRRLLPPMRLLLCGYYGFGNVGDEAILAALAQELATWHPPLQLEVLTADPSHTLRVHHLAGVNRWRAREIWRALRRADLLVQGGGGLLQDVTSAHSPAYYLGVLALARLARRPYALFAQGVGPLRRWWWRWLTVRLAEAAALVVVRDPASAAALQAWGLRRPVVVAADPAICLRPAPPEHVQGWLRARGWQLPSPYFLLIPRARQGYERSQAAAAKSLAGCGRPVLVVPFQAADREWADALASQVQQAGGQAQALEPPEDPRVAAGLVARACGVVAARLHALIFAAPAGVPALGIAYDPKVARFCAAVGYPQAEALEEASVGGWLAAVRAGSHRPHPETVERLQEASRSGFRALRALVEKLAERVGAEGRRSA
jgi:polysaccharide pyruvyl transferase CsaB